jgi:hypothetical protein
MHGPETHSPDYPSSIVRPTSGSAARARARPLKPEVGLHLPGRRGYSSRMSSHLRARESKMGLNWKREPLMVHK